MLDTVPNCPVDVSEALKIAAFDEAPAVVFPTRIKFVAFATFLSHILFYPWFLIVPFYLIYKTVHPYSTESLVQMFWTIFAISLDFVFPYYKFNNNFLLINI